MSYSERVRGERLWLSVRWKQKLLQVVEGLPDTATFEDAIERLCLLAKIEEGLHQSNIGETVPYAEAVRQFLK